MQISAAVHAVVVLQPGAGLTADELTDSCREHIANYKLPRTVEIVDALPVPGAGKILKRASSGRGTGPTEG